MYKTLLVIGVFVAALGLFAGGIFLGQANAQDGQPGWMMRNGYDGYSSGMMGNGQYGPGMMGNGQYGPGMMGNGQHAPGMMNGYGGMMGMMNGGMMGNFAGATNAEPLSIEETETAVNSYLANLNDDKLSLGEIMIFDNHAYAQILDQSTGRGAFEVLVDPVSRAVYLEPGPAMMWNSEYNALSGPGMAGMMGMMGGMMGTNAGPMSGMMDGMMGGYAPEAEASVTADEAAAIAQRYLDNALPGTVVNETADAFPGYYTLHVEQDGQISGMVSVNAYTGQVFYHFWHGTFIEQAGE
jgi:hypothetical protein